MQIRYADISMDPFSSTVPSSMACMLVFQRIETVLVLKLVFQALETRHDSQQFVFPGPKFHRKNLPVLLHHLATKVVSSGLLPSKTFCIHFSAYCHIRIKPCSFQACFGSVSIVVFLSIVILFHYQTEVPRFPPPTLNIHGFTARPYLQQPQFCWPPKVWAIRTWAATGTFTPHDFLLHSNPSFYMGGSLSQTDCQTFVFFFMARAGPVAWALL